MALISLREIFDILLMTAAVGFIFMEYLRFKPLDYPHKEFTWGSFWMASIITAPAIILHELAHKFTAIAMGFGAQFFAHYFFLAIGVILRLVHSPIIFFVPGFVVPIGSPSSGQMAVIAVAGPLVNLVLFFGSWAWLKYGKVKTQKLAMILYMTRAINLILFILNMLPIPPFDGFRFFSGLWQVLF